MSYSIVSLEHFRHGLRSVARDVLYYLVWAISGAVLFVLASLGYYFPAIAGAVTVTAVASAASLVILRWLHVKFKTHPWSVPLWPGGLQSLWGGTSGFSFNADLPMPELYRRQSALERELQELRTENRKMVQRIRELEKRTGQ